MARGHPARRRQQSTIISEVGEAKANPGAAKPQTRHAAKASLRDGEGPFGHSLQLPGLLRFVTSGTVLVDDGLVDRFAKSAFDFNGMGRLSLQSMDSFTNIRRMTIEWGDCDAAGLVLPARYFAFFDVSAWTLFEHALGVKRSELSETFAILGIPMVSVDARFISPLGFGDAIKIESRIERFGRSSFVIMHRMSKAGEIVAECDETRIWAARDSDGRIQSRPVPAEVISRFHRG
jgi:4-hydroxybenzoyl-CoA thioesterase